MARRTTRATVSQRNHRILDDERYAGEHARLSATESPRYKSDISEARREADEELREHVLHRLREQIHSTCKLLPRRHSKGANTSRPKSAQPTC